MSRGLGTLVIEVDGFEVQFKASTHFLGVAPCAGSDLLGVIDLDLVPDPLSFGEAEQVAVAFLKLHFLVESLPLRSWQDEVPH